MHALKTGARPALPYTALPSLSLTANVSIVTPAGMTTKTVSLPIAYPATIPRTE